MNVQQLRRTWGQIVFTIVALVLMQGAAALASTRIGNAELQMWYRTRNTFHTDGGNHVNWVQWRNEVYFWFIYDKFVDNGKILGQDKLEIPFVENATLNARYRFRADPVWAIRESYRNKYDRHERKSYLFPENGLRDAFLDLDFGQVGVGKLSARVGRQQIVWGESDLYRSIDVINPLRVDQNQGAGEKFDEFRSPIWALKLNYNIGNVGSWFSNVYMEPFYTPGFRAPNSDLILNGLLFRSPVHIKGCYDDNGNLIKYSAANCSFKRSDGTRAFHPWDPTWIGRRRTIHPWAPIAREPNPRSGSPDYGNGVPEGQPDIKNARISYLPSVEKGNCKGPLNGMWDWCTTALGFRIFGTSVGGFDFSLNYANIPSGVQGTYINRRFQNAPPVGGFRPDLFYGDQEDIALAKAFGGNQFSGSFREGLERCLDNKGRQGSNLRDHYATVLIGADLAGYNVPGRFGKRGALNPDGTVRPGKHGAVRLPVTLCLPAKYNYVRTNVIGFTSTYNDFDYTGAVFRLEESYSTKEYVRHLPAGNGRRVNDPLDNFTFNGEWYNFTPRWRSMVGFDLLRSYNFFRYIPFLHHSFYDQAWFLSGQWLMMHQFQHITNPLCYVVDNGGNGLTKEAAAKRTRETGNKYYSSSQCRNYRWNHLFTLGFANQGLFASRVETRNAVVFEPRAKDWLLFSQWWWRNVLGYENVELSTGVAWYPGSAMSQGWSGLYGFASRDQFWFEFTYYLL